MGGGGIGVGTVDYTFKMKYLSDSLTVITNYIILLSHFSPKNYVSDCYTENTIFVYIV